VVERGVSAPAVVVAFDPEEGALANVGSIEPRSGVDELLLVGRKERFGDGIVEACGAPSHGALHAVLCAEVREFPRRVLPRAQPVVATPRSRGATWAEMQVGLR